MPSIAIPVSLRGQLLYSTRIFDPLSLFAANEPGIWLDPSDLTTMFQDRAGSTAVTTPGQSVGLRLDKSKGLVLGPELVSNPGNPFVSTTGYSAGGLATISVDTGRLSVAQTIGFTDGVLCALPPNSFSNSVVITFNVNLGTSSLVQVQAGNGNFGNGGVLTVNITASGTYSLVTTTRSTGGSGLTFKAGSAATFFLSGVSVKELPGNHAVANSDAARGIYGIEPVGGRRNLLLNTTTMATQNVTVTAVAHTLSFTGTGTVTLSGVSTAGPLIGTGANDRVSLTFTPTAGTLTLTVSGSVTLAQLQIGSAFDAYQRVGTTQYDVTEAGRQTLHYVQYDGSDDGYVTPTITPGIDKVQVFAGVRKLSDALAGTVLEFSDSSDTNNGAFFLRAPQAAAANYIFRSKGTVVANAISPSSYAAPITNVVTGLGDIVGDVSRIRVNGAQVAETLTDQGTGNYLAYPLYIGRRGGTTLPFNGRDYGIITRFGANLDDSTIAATESWLNQKTGAY